MHGRESFHHIIPFTLVSVLCLALASNAYGHKVYLFAWIDGDTVYTESYSSGNKKVRGGLVTVFDPAGKKLFEGNTDEKGGYSFKSPGNTDLRIVLEAPMGHKAEFLLKADDVSGTQISQKPATSNQRSEVPSSSVGMMDIGQVKTLMEETLDSRLRPILRTLAKIQEGRGPGLTEIIGGIGYIFGIMGLILYLRGRKKD
jgi:nickel transport protein